MNFLHRTPGSFSRFLFSIFAFFFAFFTGRQDLRAITFFSFCVCVFVWVCECVWHMCVARVSQYVSCYPHLTFTFVWTLAFSPVCPFRPPNFHFAAGQKSKKKKEGKCENVCLSFYFVYLTTFLSVCLLLNFLSTPKPNPPLQGAPLSFNRTFQCHTHYGFLSWLIRAPAWLTTLLPPTVPLPFLLLFYSKLSVAH